ncbi:MAG TPA: hypothetical protein PKY53_07000 [Clostridia bacterium]|nr:hypothetical protein [Clostridia bacterium]
MSCYYVIGIRVDNRVDNALKIQETLTKNGCIIKTRLGLHDVSETSCANDGLILLQPCGEREEIEKLVADLNGIGGVRAKLIDLN